MIGSEFRTGETKSREHTRIGCRFRVRSNRALCQWHNHILRHVSTTPAQFLNFWFVLFSRRSWCLQSPEISNLLFNDFDLCRWTDQTFILIPNKLYLDLLFDKLKKGARISLSRRNFPSNSQDLLIAENSFSKFQNLLAVMHFIPILWVIGYNSSGFFGKICCGTMTWRKKSNNFQFRCHK